MKPRWGIYHNLNLETGELYDLETFESPDSLAAAYEEMNRRWPTPPRRTAYRCPHCDTPLFPVTASPMPRGYEHALGCVNNLCRDHDTFYLPSSDGLQTVSRTELMRLYHAQVVAAMNRGLPA